MYDYPRASAPPVDWSCWQSMALLYFLLYGLDMLYTLRGSWLLLPLCYAVYPHRLQCLTACWHISKCPECPTLDHLVKEALGYVVQLHKVHAHYPITGKD